MRSIAGSVEVRGLLAREVLRPILVVATRAVAGRRLGQLRLLGPAAVVGERAAVGEDAARDLGAEARQEAGDRVEAALVLADAAARNAAQEADRVRVPRILEHRPDRPLLDEPARVEDADAAAHLRDHAEVVADEEDGGVELGLQARDEIEDLGLDRRIEARRRLVEDQQLGLFRERHRDHDALLHAAGELMRVAPEDARGVGDLDLDERLAGTLHRFLRGHAEHREGLGDLRSDPQARVQRGAGVLVDHRDRLGVVLAQSP